MSPETGRPAWPASTESVTGHRQGRRRVVGDVYGLLIILLSFLEEMTPECRLWLRARVKQRA